MRHRHSGRQLNRNSSYRKAMFRNMTASLVEHELIKTTLPKAKELVLLGEKIDARQAQALGLANWVVPEDERMTKAREVAERLAALPARARRQRWSAAES